MRTQTWQHAGRHVSALVSEIPKRNGWTIAPQAGDRTPDRTQRLLNRAVWDGAAAMSGARRFVVTGLDAVAGRRARRGLRIAALDETGQQKAGTATCGIRQTMSRAEPARGHGADVESVLPPAVVEVGRNRGGVDDCATLEARMNEQQTAWQAIGDTHRSEWAVLVASATRVAGDRDLAEECVQDAYARAVALWPAQGVPANPAAWLTTVARRCALDLHRHAQTANRLAPLAARADVVPGPDDIVAGPAVGHRIRLLGVCGHPTSASRRSWR